jgi:hypothetical protein
LIKYDFKPVGKYEIDRLRRILLLKNKTDHLSQKIFKNTSLSGLKFGGDDHFFQDLANIIY